MRLLNWKMISLFLFVNFIFFMGCPSPVNNPGDNIVQSSNSALSSITLSAGSIIFNKNIMYYEIIVPFGTGSITVTTIAEDSNAVLTSSVDGVNFTAFAGSEDVALPVAGNIYTIRSVSEDGASTRNYRIKITVAPEGASGDSSLSSLSMDYLETDIPFTEEFSAGTLNYTASQSLPYEIYAVSIEAVKNDSGAIVSGVGTKALAVGENVFNIVVTAANGSLTIYSITVIRLEQVITTLASLTTSSGIMDYEFDKDRFNYNVMLPYSASPTPVTINASLINPDTVLKYSIDGSEPVNFQGSLQVTPVAGATVSLTLSVHYKLDETKFTIYTIDLNMALAGATNNTSLSSLEVYDPFENPLTLSPAFNSSLTTYTLENSVDHNIDNITITSLAEGTVINSGYHYLSIGANNIILTVIAPDGITKKNYTITILRNEPPTVTISDLADGDTISTPNFTINGIINDPHSEVNNIFVSLSGVEFTATLNPDKSFSIPINAAGFTNGTKKLLLIFQDEYNGDLTRKVIFFTYTGGNDGYSIKGTISMANDIPISEGYLYLHLCDIDNGLLYTSTYLPLSEISMPYEFTVDGIPDGTSCTVDAYIGSSKEELNEFQYTYWPFSYFACQVNGGDVENLNIIMFPNF